MSSTGLPAFDTTVQHSNLWLKDLMTRLGTDDKEQAYHVLRAVLHAIRDRIGPENAVHLGAQLPTLIRGMYYEGWHMAATPTKERHLDAFLDHLQERLARGPRVPADKVARAVFALLFEKIDPRELSKVTYLLPSELESLWLDSPQAAEG